MSKSPNIVLVHGAWADGSSWSGVIQRLQEAGYHVAAVQLGLTSLDEDVTRTRALLAAQTGPTLVVAHSFGGAVITQLGADAPNVIGLVYESAFAPDQGETLKGLLSQPPQAPGGAAIHPDQGVTSGWIRRGSSSSSRLTCPWPRPGCWRQCRSPSRPTSSSARQRSDLHPGGRSPRGT